MVTTFLNGRSELMTSSLADAVLAEVMTITLSIPSSGSAGKSANRKVCEKLSAAYLALKRNCANTLPTTSAPPTNEARLRACAVLPPPL